MSGSNNKNGISVLNLTKKFGNITALNQLSIDIPRGTIVGLLGQNGAGKSTLVRLLAGVMKPTSGTAMISSYDLIKEVTKIKQITGLLPEEYALYEKLTVYEYIEFLGTLYSMPLDEIGTNFSHLSDQLEINSLQNRLIETLSKGQKQKVALIAALIHQPEIVFLDEPLANLDITAQRVVRAIINDYKRQDRIIIIATHLMSNVELLCDHLLLIDKGSLLYSGSSVDFQSPYSSLEEAYINLMENRK